MSVISLLRGRFQRRGIRGLLQTVSLGVRSLTKRKASVNGVTVPLRSPIEYRVRGRILAGNYENEEMGLIESHLPKDDDVVELGAGVGVVSAFIHNRISRDARSVALEANPDLIPIIEEVRRLNGCNFEIDNRAYSSSGESVELTVGTTLTRSSVHTTGKKTKRIHSTDLKGLIEECEFEEFSLIIDIEGAEFDLLRNEYEVLKEHCPLVILEIHRHVEEEGLSVVKQILGQDYTLVDDEDPVFVFVRTDRHSNGD